MPGFLFNKIVGLKPKILQTYQTVANILYNEFCKIFEDFLFTGLLQENSG